MEGIAGRDLECQKTMDGKENNGNVSEKAIPSCCLKARASAPELDAKCHSTVVSGWFSEFHSCSGIFYLFFLPFPFHFFYFLVIYLGIFGLNWLLMMTLFLPFIVGKTSKKVYFNNPMWPGMYHSSYASSFNAILSPLVDLFYAYMGRVLLMTVNHLQLHFFVLISEICDVDRNLPISFFDPFYCLK